MFFLGSGILPSAIVGIFFAQIMSGTTIGKTTFGKDVTGRTPPAKSMKRPRARGFDETIPNHVCLLEMSVARRDSATWEKLRRSKRFWQRHGEWAHYLRRNSGRVCGSFVLWLGAIAVGRGPRPRNKDTYMTWIGLFCCGEVLCDDAVWHDHNSQ